MYDTDYVRIWTWFFLYEFTMGQLSVPWVNFSFHGSTFHGSTFHGSNCVSIRSTFFSVNVPMGLLSVGQTSNGSTKMGQLTGHPDQRMEGAEWETQAQMNNNLLN